MAARKGLLFDIVNCVGCGECYAACKKEYNNGEPKEEFLTERLSAKNYTVVESYEDYYARKLCFHCNEPTCVSVCPVAALEKTELGPVIYYEDRCIGCRYCMQACPHTIPRYEWGEADPGIQKCTLCHHRLLQGEQTACAEACIFEATTFGDVEELIEIAKQRIEENPDSYYPKIYGLVQEGKYQMPVAGGTSVFIIGPEPFEQFGYVGDLPDEPLPQRTQVALDKIPTVVSFGTLFLGGMYWLTKRKNDIAKEEKGGEK